MTRYDYGSAYHKQWREALKRSWGLRGCYVCDRHAANPKTGKRRKGVRLHAHHVRGTASREGVILCATCHELVTLLSGHGRQVFETPSMMRKLRQLVAKRLEGPITHTEEDTDE